MANWDIDWRPSYGYRLVPEHRTAITSLDNGGTQRRQKWTRERYHVYMSFGARESDTIDAIMAFYKAREGAYEAFNFPGYSQYIKGTRLSISNSNPDWIGDSSGELLSRGFDTDHDVWVNGSGEDNDGIYGVQTATTVQLTLDAEEAVTTETSNSSLEIFPVYSMRFADDDLGFEWTSYGIGAIATVHLIEDI